MYTYIKRSQLRECVQKAIKAADQADEGFDGRYREILLATVADMRRVAVGEDNIDGVLCPAAAANLKPHRGSYVFAESFDREIARVYPDINVNLAVILDVEEGD